MVFYEVLSVAILSVFFKQGQALQCPEDKIEFEFTTATKVGVNWEAISEGSQLTYRNDIDSFLRNRESTHQEVNVTVNADGEDMSRVRLNIITFPGFDAKRMCIIARNFDAIAFNSPLNGTFIYDIPVMEYTRVCCLVSNGCIPPDLLKEANPIEIIIRRADLTQPLSFKAAYVKGCVTPSVTVYRYLDR